MLQQLVRILYWPEISRERGACTPIGLPSPDTTVTFSSSSRWAPLSPFSASSFQLGLLPPSLIQESRSTENADRGPKVDGTEEEEGRHGPPRRWPSTTSPSGREGEGEMKRVGKGKRRAQGKVPREADLVVGARRPHPPPPRAFTRQWKQFPFPPFERSYYIGICCGNQESPRHFDFDPPGMRPH